METGPTTSTSPQPFPSVKHLVWALVAGTALVISGTRDHRPPQPPATAAAAPAPAPPGASALARATAHPAGPAPALARLVPAGLVPEPPHYLRRPSAAPTSPPLQAPLVPLPSAPATASPPDRSPAGPAPSGPAPVRSSAVQRPAVRPLPPSTPLRLKIPSIEVDAPMMKLALNAAGALEPPPDNNPVLTGWYAGGTVPGAVGTAVTAGHVDTRLGPGVFYDLGAVRKGATVEIVRADRRTAVFTVYAIEVHDKKDFPDQRVYGPSARPEVRLITCAGDYDKKSGYSDNVVVYAALTASR